MDRGAAPEWAGGVYAAALVVRAGPALSGAGAVASVDEPVAGHARRRRLAVLGLPDHRRVCRHRDRPRLAVHHPTPVRRGGPTRCTLRPSLHAVDRRRLDRPAPRPEPGPPTTDPPEERPGQGPRPEPATHQRSPILPH